MSYSGLIPVWVIAFLSLLPIFDSLPGISCLQGLNSYKFSINKFSFSGFIDGLRKIFFGQKIPGEGFVNPSLDDTSSKKTTLYSEKPKGKKPDLTVKTSPSTELEKDKEKIAKCTHDKLSNFKIDKLEEVESTLCDFEGENNNPDHKAFDSVTDNAFICDNCHGILCKNCVEDYSDEE